MHPSRLATRRARPARFRAPAAAACRAAARRPAGPPAAGRARRAVQRARAQLGATATAENDRPPGPAATRPVASTLPSSMATRGRRRTLNHASITRRMVPRARKRTAAPPRRSFGQCAARGSGDRARRSRPGIGAEGRGHELPAAHAAVSTASRLLQRRPPRVADVAGDYPRFDSSARTARRSASVQQYCAAVRRFRAARGRPPRRAAAGSPGAPPPVGERAPRGRAAARRTRRGTRGGRRVRDRAPSACSRWRMWWLTAG